MMHLARATYDGKVHAHSINATQPDRWRHKDGVTVIEFDRKTAIAAARFLAKHRPKRDDRMEELVKSFFVRNKTGIGIQMLDPITGRLKVVRWDLF